MSDMPQTRASRRTDIDRKEPRRSRRRRVIWVIGGLLGLLAAAVVVLSALAVSKALTVRDSLTPAVPIASGMPAKVLAGDLEGAAADAASLKELSARAVATTAEADWRLAEWIPVVGQNLAAVRAAAESVDEVADFSLKSLPSLDLTAFRPVDGAVDLSAIHRLEGVVTSGAATFAAVSARLDSTDQTFLLPQVTEALSTLRDAVAGVDESLGALSPILKVLPAALGEEAPRTYLLMFQGNSELRASGGNPAALALVTATGGRIELTTQATSVQFANAREESIAPLDAETEHIYSDIIGRWIPNMTATPDFPTTVEIMRAWWADEGLPPFDDVISTDPVALAYILKATGPIPLQTGEILTSENAVPLLLNEVYFKYGDGTDQNPQDLFFASAAAQIFSKITSGVENPLAFVDALVKASDEGRMKIWSSNPTLEAMMAGSKLSGTLPATNEDKTVAGVFFNDTTGAKTDYYADASVVATTDQCTTTGIAPTFTQTITFANNITPEQADNLPYFITGPHYDPGSLATDVVIYSPVGAAIESWEVGGAQSATLVSQGTHLGRSVARISVLNTPQTASTITVVMKGAEGTTGADYGAYDVWTTPMVRETPIAVEAPGCG
ncbi:DUF4012 domain-containing protein [Microbacterium sp. TPD7012]|uniref:DUF4012 domain-containing protein n=1 Tax=Microbacterium sp. TPD7012 TaxID=2171975 RepID=UPI000D50F000|nr:DUF4012 domain-containing protein [Microbacterium sp. TPD7012]PVE97114.1 hypothetical protein DC434_06955 [Microbacterium sp. TPD7012]